MWRAMRVGFIVRAWRAIPFGSRPLKLTVRHLMKSEASISAPRFYI
jgi:hypothetical protein